MQEENMEINTVPKMPAAFYESRLLSSRQAAEMLGVSKMTLWRFTQDKKDPIPSVKIGHNRKFKLDKLLWWIEKHEQ